ncbi:LRR receptor-like serine/threonine-protein kinase RPK2 [Silene latifolia]|uniref:LRR receptor-like serine/threonine-protein kinase RPK2 n=1 Tax=Silene latifolia TaxID=37657 RepID=UPI003D786789
MSFPLFFSLFSFFLLSHISTASPSNDTVSLLSVKSAVTLDPTRFLSTWLSTTDHCTWPGVTCSSSSNSHVTSLNLAGKNLAGTLHSAAGNLSELRFLSLQNNAFSGDIPPEIGNLRRLETLELQSNNFSGRIPNLVVSSVRVVNLSFNLLTGPIPEGLIGFGRVRVLDLSNNQLSGKINLGNGDCLFLQHLKLSNNFIVGNVVREIGRCVNLRTLLLDGNILEGSIPPEIGAISELRVLDLSRNSLTDEIPKGLGKCRKLSVIVLTNLEEYRDDRSLSVFRGEYNAFVGGIPEEVFMIPGLRVLWAPRANIGGRLWGGWGEGCSLEVVNLGQNYMEGMIPRRLGLCRNLSFLDLSSNLFEGDFPSLVRVPCVVFLNVSRNSLSGVLTPYVNSSCGKGGVLEEKDLGFLDEEDIWYAYSTVSIWSSKMNGRIGLMPDDGVIITHDFGWNNFSGPLPLFTLPDELFVSNWSISYNLLLNDNGFNGSIPLELLSECSRLHIFSVNLTANKLSGEIYPTLLQECMQLTRFEAAENQITGSISARINSLIMLNYLDLNENRLSGPLPEQLGDLKHLKSLLLGHNNFTGPIPSKLSQLTLLEVLDLSENNLSGAIPTTLGNTSNLEILLLDHNMLTRDIPESFSLLSHLVLLDVSYNNLTGRIPPLRHINDCESFKGNSFLHSCPEPYSLPPAGLPYPLEVHNDHHHRKMKSLIIATAASISVVLGVLLMIVLGLTLGRKKLRGLTRLRRKVVVTFTDTPIELTYDNVVSATGNFSIRNLIGTGGFGSTYKAELVPGYLVAVKRLSMGRFQGIQQFEAEIKTLGRVRHRNLVTLIGYYVGDTEMFLIYNYLSGGNLETFIHNRSAGNVKWAEIYKITDDVAHALACLHYSCVPRIVHRDIKPSNILLDEELNAYLSDFGLARLLEVSQTHATTDVAGTFGYVAPEYATTCRVSDKADVYSFGVVLLELMSGKKSFDPSFSEYNNGFNIVRWATLLVDEDRSSEFFCSDLWEAGPEENLLKMLRLALSCTVEALSVRPSMKQVLEKLKQLST